MFADSDMSFQPSPDCLIPIGNGSDEHSLSRVAAVYAALPSVEDPAHSISSNPLGPHNNDLEHHHHQQPSTSPPDWFVAAFSQLQKPPSASASDPLLKLQRVLAIVTLVFCCVAIGYGIAIEKDTKSSTGDLTDLVSKANDRVGAVLNSADTTSSNLRDLIAAVRKNGKIGIEIILDPVAATPPTPTPIYLPCNGTHS